MSAHALRGIIIDRQEKLEQRDTLFDSVIVSLAEMLSGREDANVSPQPRHEEQRVSVDQKVRRRTIAQMSLRIVAHIPCNDGIMMLQAISSGQNLDKRKFVRTNFPRDKFVDKLRLNRELEMRFNRLLRNASPISLAVCAIAWSAPGLAQGTGNPADNTDEASESNTIIVTAQRREQNLQDVPAAVTALTGAALDHGNA